MSWEDRLSDFIGFTSPSGRKFTAAWVGNDRSLEKKLGIFEFAEARGVVVQDLDVGAVKYPLNFFFHGADHDIEAARFFEACKERGTWRVTHPVRGDLTLQLVSVTEKVQPVTSGGITEFDTDWIEPSINLPEASIAEVTATVYQAIVQLQDESAGQFEDTVEPGNALKTALDKALRALDKAKQQVLTATEGSTESRNTFVGLINAPTMAVASLASATITYVTLPVGTDLSARMRYYESVIDSTLAELTPAAPTVGGINYAATAELVVLAAASGIVQAVSETDLTTREDALYYLNRVDAAFLRVVNGLDAYQTIYADDFIDTQYFSQSQSFTEMVRVLTLLRQLLLIRSFDLSTAKYLTLRKDRAPIEIAITEGVDLDAFIAYNHLKGDEILLLPTGRQVVVYL